MNPTTDRTNITDTGYSFGGKDYTKETRYDGNNNPYSVDVLKGSTPSPTANYSPTVVSNYGMDKKVNDISSTYQNNVSTSIPSFPTGTKRAVYAPSGDGYTGELIGYAGTPQEEEQMLGSYQSQNQTSTGGQFNAPQDAQLQPNGTYLYQGNYYTKDQLASPENLAAISNTSNQQKKYDDALQKELDAINKRFDLYRQQQQQVTGSGAAGAQNALLQSGAGGRGSVAQYAAVTADARVNSIMADGQRALQELDSKRDQLLSAATLAYQDKDYELLSKLNTQIEGNRKEMLATAQKANEKVAEETKNAAKSQVVSDLYAQGINDVASILSSPEAKKLKLTSKDVSDILGDIVPPGLDDLIKTLRNNGAPQDVIQKVLSSGNINDAYKNAGNFAAGGTGIIGEYNFYRSQAEAAGQKPVDFNTYQNIDANRKIAIAKASSGGKTTVVDSNGKVKTVDLKALNENQARDFTYAQRAQQASPTIDSITNDIVNMGAFEYKGYSALEKTGLAGSKVPDAIKQVRQAERNFLTAVLRRESGAQIADSELAMGERLYFPVPGDDATTIAQKKSARNTAIKTIASNVPQYEDRATLINDVEDPTSILIKSETEAKDAINKVYTSLPSEVKGALKTLYDADYNDADVYEYLRNKGYF